MQDENSPAQEETNSLPASCDPERWVEEHGDYLFGYAMARLRDSARAEDAVQETFLAALKAGNFAGKSVERGWLIGILKNKIFDHFRKTSRETSFTDLDFYSEEESDRFVAKGIGKGGWIQGLAPLEWPSNPGEALDNEVFWKVFNDCAGKLPPKVNAVFCLREMDNVESNDICAQLEISESNLWVMLHRARMALRRCLETNWFGKM